jgi:hypothetical protein
MRESEAQKGAGGSTRRVARLWGRGGRRRRRRRRWRRDEEGRGSLAPAGGSVERPRRPSRLRTPAPSFVLTRGPVTSLPRAVGGRRAPRANIATTRSGLLRINLPAVRTSSSLGPFARLDPPVARTRLLPIARIDSGMIYPRGN